METMKILLALENCQMAYNLGEYNEAITKAIQIIQAQGERIADLENELRDERHRHDRLQDFEVAEAWPKRRNWRRLKQSWHMPRVIWRIWPRSVPMLVRFANTWERSMRRPARRATTPARIAMQTAVVRIAPVAILSGVGF